MTKEITTDKIMIDNPEPKGERPMPNPVEYYKMTIRGLVAEARKLYESVEGFMLSGSLTGKVRDVKIATAFALLLPLILDRLETIATKAEEYPEMSPEALVEAHRIACGSHALATASRTSDEDQEYETKMNKARDTLFASLKAAEEIIALIGRGSA